MEVHLDSTGLGWIVIGHQKVARHATTLAKNQGKTGYDDGDR
jgi:hypothetical protein